MGLYNTGTGDGGASDNQRKRENRSGWRVEEWIKLGVTVCESERERKKKSVKIKKKK